MEEAGLDLHNSTKADAFIEAKMKYYRHEANDDDVRRLDCLLRPSLTHVLRALVIVR